MKTAKTNKIMDAEKIMIIGICGAGKSTLAAHLGELTGLPVFHIDKVALSAGWKAVPREEYLPQIESWVEGDRWIIDGDYSGSLEVRMERADLVIWLDFNRFAAYRGLKKRRKQYFDTVRPDVADGCIEKEGDHALLVVWALFGYFVEAKPRTKRLLKKYPDKRVVRLKNRKQVEEWLKEIENSHKN